MGSSAAVQLPRSFRRPILPDFPNSPFEGYATNYLQRNFWKVQHIFGDFEDAMSEAQVIFYECRKMYGAKVNSQAHFMALYKQMISCYFIDWAKFDSAERSVLPTEDIEPSISSEATLSCLLREASSELKVVLKMVLDAPADVAETFRKEFNGSRKGVDRFFLKAVQACGLPDERASFLQEELMGLLS